MTSTRSAALSALLIAAAAAGCGVVADAPASRREAAAEAAYPPTGKMIEVEGLRIHAHVEGRAPGSAPDVVLIHGASGNTRDFTHSLTARLAPHYRVIAFDRPGLGWSEDGGERAISPEAQAALLRAAAAQLGVRDPIVVGHSYGAAVALAWALEAPEATRGVVTIAGATMPWPGGLGPWYSITGSRLGQATVVPMLAAFAPLSRADAAIAAIFAPDPVPTGYGAHVGAGLSLRRATIAANARQVNGLRPSVVAMSARYPGLAVPVEVIHGTADRIVPYEIHAVPLTDTLPQARLTTLEGVGHMPHHSRPDAVLAAIARLAGR
jgi:pimeloyl-ACP methyl ester carboxylesterase